ncbi:dienelactone hydrolase family protein [Nocardia sp. CDC159]|uniref:Dienelactone hydrolase family protein n=1 Tax=Nocardia pulmonis TaxID=2951408 RepID=A0A9X2J066_9NOCA|nr:MULTISPECIES: dienelactone hydrolase family protein [Nocardia]MCM6778178.1 dienelactone hydrolase family protein [Nocardia pulmonis]MCM6791067.1 dienelactone hydrolase family protein [Nocardia sp. CDC159]
MTAVQGLSVDVPTPDGVADAYVAYPDDGAAHPGVLLYMDAFGLRPALLRLVDRIAEHGYTVLAPNLFYRHGRTPVFELPEFIDFQQRPDLFGTIMPLVHELTAEVIVPDAGAYLDWLAAFDRTAPGPFGATGYCMGGRQSLRTAAAYPNRIAAAAGFHTGGLVTDGTDSPHLDVATVRAELYFGHADEDPSMNPDQIETLDKALAAAGVRHRTEVYRGAQHGYTQSDTSAYNAEADERHLRELLALFERTLR